MSTIKKTQNKKYPRTVKVANSFIVDHRLSMMTARELDFFFAMVALAKDSEGGEIVIGIKEAKRLCGLPERTSTNVFEEVLDSLDEKVGAKAFYFHSNGWNMKKRLFHGCGLSEDRKHVKFEVDQELLTYILNITKKFILFRLNQFTSLSSKYSKLIFLQLMRFSGGKGEWSIPLDRFRELCDIPPSYRLVDIERRVFEVAIKELSWLKLNITVDDIEGEKWLRLFFTMPFWQEAEEEFELLACADELPF